VLYLFTKSSVFPIVSWILRIEDAIEAGKLEDAGSRRIYKGGVFLIGQSLQDFVIKTSIMRLSLSSKYVLLLQNEDGLNGIRSPESYIHEIVADRYVLRRSIKM